MSAITSSGHAKAMVTGKSLSEIYNGGKIEVRSAPIPATADAGATGTLLYSLTNGSLTTPAKQKITFTPTTSGTTGTFTIDLNGITFTFTDDASPTAAEVATALFRLINTAQGTAAKYFTNSTDGAITAGGRITIPDIYQLFTVTDGTGSVVVEAATAGVPFSYSCTATGAGNSMAAVETVADAPGLHFDPDTTLTYLQKLAAQVWSGLVGTSGTPAYFRVISKEDVAPTSSSTTVARIQGTLSSTPGADGYITNSTVTAGQTVNVNTFKVQVPIT